MNADAALPADGVELAAQQGIGADATGHHQPLKSGLRHRSQRFFNQHIHNRRLRGSGQIGLAVFQLGAEFFRLRQHGGFQAGE